MEKQISSTVQCARAIRKELKQEFPNIKFSVRSEQFAGGDAVRINYTDAIPSEEVRKITDKYQYGTFDGMTDMYNMDNVNDNIPQAKYVQVYREISEEARATVVKKLSEMYDREIDGWEPIVHTELSKTTF